MLLPCVGAVLLGLLANALEGTPEEAFADIVDAGIFGIVVPIGCLVVGDAVLGAEVRSGTLHFTWLSPVGFGAIVTGRWLAGWLVTVLALSGSAVLAAVAAGAAGAAPAIGVAVGAASAAYVALFILIGSITRRAAVWSLAIVLLVERLLGAALDGIAQLSPTWLGRAVYAELGPDASDLIRSGVPGGWSAVVRLAVVAVVMLLLARWRLGRVPIAGATD